MSVGGWTFADMGCSRAVGASDEPSIGRGGGLGASQRELFRTMVWIFFQGLVFARGEAFRKSTPVEAIVVALVGAVHSTPVTESLPPRRSIVCGGGTSTTRAPHHTTAASRSVAAVASTLEPPN